MRIVLALFLSLCAACALAKDKMVLVDARPGVSVPVYLMQREGAQATLALLPGGAGGLGGVVDGKPSGANFLVRSRDLFAEAGFNVAVVGRASDHAELDFAYRTSAEHVGDLRAVIDFLKHELRSPVWLIGTSRGTISATAAAIALGQERLAGLVLTATVTRGKPGAVPEQDLAAIRLPVLVLHHQHDACRICVPQDLPAMLREFTHAPQSKLLLLNGGGPASGNVCGAWHYHGFPGQEKAAVDAIADWIKQLP